MSLGPVWLAAVQALGPCPRCHAERGDPCRTPRYRTCLPHKERPVNPLGPTLIRKRLEELGRSSNPAWGLDRP